MNEFNVLLAAATNGTPSGSLFDALFARYIAPQESWRELESPLPITILAAGEDLIDYRIYGANGGVGEPTESGEPVGYKLPMVVRSRNLFDPNDPDIEHGYYYGYNNVISTAYGNNSWESGWIPVTPGDYTFYLKRKILGFYLYVNFYDSQKEFVKTIVNVTNPDGFYTRTISDVGYVRFNGINYYSTDWLVARGNVTTYIPYYRDEENIYIGSDPLAEDEYVDFGEQKIYRMEGGTLTPTDPPVPIPALPTIQGETIIDYNPSTTPAVEPEKMYIKYKPQ